VTAPQLFDKLPLSMSRSSVLSTIQECAIYLSPKSRGTVNVADSVLSIPSGACSVPRMCYYVTVLSKEIARGCLCRVRSLPSCRVKRLRDSAFLNNCDVNLLMVWAKLILCCRIARRTLDCNGIGGRYDAYFCSLWIQKLS